jgi:hypothetical protein
MPRLISQADGPVPPPAGEPASAQLIARNAGLLAAADVAGKLALLVLYAVMARTLGASGLGAFTLAISVDAAVATTTARPRPLTIAEPANNIDVRSASGVRTSRAGAAFRCGSLSPVSADSSADNRCASSTRASAGTTSPERQSQMSPGTSSVAETIRGWPSRRTSTRPPSSLRHDARTSWLRRSR